MPSTYQTLRIYVDNAKESYYADLLVDENLVLGEIPQGYLTFDDIPADVLNDLKILKKYQIDGKRPLQMNDYIYNIGIRGNFKCESIGTSCKFSTTSHMPSTVQLLLMDNEYNFYVSEEILCTFNNEVHIDFNTMKVTYNRNLYLHWTNIIQLIVLVIGFAFIFIHKYFKFEMRDAISDFKTTAIELCFYFLYGFVLINSIKLSFIPFSLGFPLIATVGFILQTETKLKVSVSMCLINLLIAGCGVAYIWL